MYIQFISLYASFAVTILSSSAPDGLLEIHAQITNKIYLNTNTFIEYLINHYFNFLHELHS